MLGTSVYNLLPPGTTIGTTETVIAAQRCYSDTNVGLSFVYVYVAIYTTAMA